MQQRAEKTRSAILSAARTLFAAGGFAATSVDSIAAKAKANKQRIYAYFGSKRRLFEAVLLEVFSESAAEFAAFAASFRPGEQDLTFELSQYYQKLHLEKPEFQRLLSWANLEDAIDPVALSQARKSENQALKLWFDRERDAGRIRTDAEVESWLLTVMGTAYFASSNALTLRETLGESFFQGEARRRRSRDLARLFRSGGGPDEC